MPHLWFNLGLNMKYLILILSLFGIDIYLKDSIQNSYTDIQNKCKNSKLKDFIILEKYYNKGFAYGKLDNNEKLVRNITLMFTIYIIVRFIMELFSNNKLRKLNLFSYSLIIAGAFSNLRDRFKYNKVIDYFRFKKIFKKTIFNLADIYIIIASFFQVLGGVLVGK